MCSAHEFFASRQQKEDMDSTDSAQQQQRSLLRKILLSLSELSHRKCDQEVSEREVEALRIAFERCMESTPRPLWPKQADQCENILFKLGHELKKNPQSKTGDEDKHLHGRQAWAPLSMPLQRRTQTLAVSMFCFFTTVPFCILLSIYLLINPWTRPLMIVYICVIFFRRKKGLHLLKRKDWMVNSSFWKAYRDYFPIRLLITKEVRAAITPDRNYMFCYHPHGIHSFGAMINFGTNANDIERLLPGIEIHCQTLAVSFYIPFFREFVRFAALGDASKTTILKTLSSKKGKSVLIVVGGAEESLRSSPHTNDLTLSNRRGFVKLALMKGAPLVPIFGFGETNVYNNLADGRPRVQHFLKKMEKIFHVAFPLIGGRGFFNYKFGLLPHRRPVITVVGPPLVLPKIESPTQEEIDKWHSLYVAEVVNLYHSNKDVYDLFPRKAMEVK